MDVPQQLGLFDPPPGTPDVPETEGLSANRRRTLRQRAMLDGGVHPLTAVRGAGKIQLHPQAAAARGPRGPRPALRILPLPADGQLARSGAPEVLVRPEQPGRREHALGAAAAGGAQREQRRAGLVARLLGS
jgi:hypothetical protein